VPALLIVKNPHLAMTGEALIGALSEYNPRWLQSSWGNGWYKPSGYRFQFMLPRLKVNCTQRSVGTGGVPEATTSTYPDATPPLLLIPSLYA
jgi:hypothetical protein